MGALFSRVKTWVTTEDVTHSDLNAEFDNILNNLTAANVDDFSANASQMQTTADPGEVGSESLATSVAGEISRLRHLIREITGEDEWYESPVSSLTGLANAIGSGLTNNRLVSGQVVSGSQQPQFLVPNGAAATATVEGATTNFIYYVDGTEYTISTNTNLTGLTAAPSSNNTCLINDAVANDQEYTKYTGENGTEIPVDTMGSEISALVGKWAAFSIAGTATEYFLAYVESTTRLTKARRGYFFDSTDAAVPRAGYANNDTITLLKLAWIFAKTDLTLTVTYNNPIWADDEPSSPSIGDYWFDISANTWKVRGASSWSAAGAVLIGVTAQDTTNCIAARSFEFFKNYDELNTCELNYASVTEVHAKEPGSQVSVWGAVIKNDFNKHIWDITADRDSGVNEDASTTYFAYLTETGDTLISNIRPYDRREDLKGWYHPHKSWRCVGSFFNGSGSDIEAASVESFFSRYSRRVITPSQTAASLIEIVPKIIRLDGSGGAYSEHLPAAALCTGQVLEFIRVDDTPANAVTLDPFASETINGNTTFALYTKYEMLQIFSTGTEWLIRQHQTLTQPVIYTPTYTGFGTVAETAMYWHRNGAHCIIRGRVTVGTPTGVEARMSLPTGVTSVSTIATLEVCGYVARNAQLAGSFHTLIEPSVAYLTWGRSTATEAGLAKALGSSYLGAGEILSIAYAAIEVVGWRA